MIETRGFRLDFSPVSIIRNLAQIENNFLTSDIQDCIIKARILNRIFILLRYLLSLQSTPICALKTINGSAQKPINPFFSFRSLEKKTAKTLFAQLNQSPANLS